MKAPIIKLYLAHCETRLLHNQASVTSAATAAGGRTHTTSRDHAWSV